jgi:hypothetical protein
MKYALPLLLVIILTNSCFSADAAPPLPSAASNWLDGKPLKWEQLKGKIVLLNVWTFGCWNSYRSLPWIVSLQQKFPEMQIIGIHTPEFAHEKDRNKMKDTMASYKVTYPQLLDDDFQYWRQLNNRYWPSFYVVDKNGIIRGKYIGETHANDSQAKQIEKLIQELTQSR